jgi:hypothetical protein
MKKILLILILFLFSNCSKEIDRREYMDKIKDLKTERSKVSRDLQENVSIEGLNVKLLELQKTANDLPDISGWDKDDSLKIYFKEAISNDLDYYNLKKDRMAPTGMRDSIYQKMDDVKHMEKSLFYDIHIMKIILDQERALKDMKDFKEY